MAAKHMRPEGLFQGYYCLRCGQGGLNMYGMGRDHKGVFAQGSDLCEPNPELVAILRELNK